MRLLLIHQAFTSPDDAGGTRHFEFAQRCIGDGHSFAIVASDVSYLSGKRRGQRARLVSKEHVQGVRILRAYTYASLHRSFVWRVVSFLSFMVTSVVAGLKAGPVDVVMGTSPPIFQAVSAWAVSVIRRCPFLLEIRDLWPEFAIGMGILRNPLLITLSRWLERFLYNRATHILVNSPAYRDYLQTKGINPAKITLISNGVDASMFAGSSDREMLRQRWSLNGKFLVTYAGALGPANDIPVVLEAARALSSHDRIHWLLVGDGKERGNLESMAREWKLGNVTFTGALPKKEMPAILAASDACLAILKNIPMFKTTYPNKVFDYMAAARSTILAIDGVIREVVEKAEGGIFVPPGNAKALADAVLSLERDRERTRTMGEAARAYVVEHFDREKQAKEFVSLLTSLVHPEFPQIRRTTGKRIRQN
jgi:glycosyltransferase involved in cell wall biosynthesis